MFQFGFLVVSIIVRAILTAVVFGECSEHAQCSRDDAGEREQTDF